jgi:hypothetical protein
MVNISGAKVLCYDLGLFTEQCLRLLRDVASVKYFVPHIDAFPEPFKSKIGEGMDGMERVEWFWDHVDEADLIFVPDTMCNDIVEFLRKHDYPVAGVGRAEFMELDRWKGRTIQKENGLPVQETYNVKGITELEKFLRENKDFYIKINMFRGLEESFHHVDWKQTEDTFYNIAHKLGPYREDINFICEEGIEGIEPGIDALVWDGELLGPAMVGFEGKGVGIIERVYDKREDLPEPLLWLHEGLAPEFKRLKTRFFYSAECRVVRKNGVLLPFLIDITNRLAAPGTSAIQCEIIKNYTEVVMGMGTGERVEPVYTHKYGVALPFDSMEAKCNWVNISFPPEMRRWVKLRMAVKKSGNYYAVPGFESCGCVIALDDDMEKAIKMVDERGKEIKGKRLDTASGEFNTILENIKKAKGMGVKF